MVRCRCAWSCFSVAHNFDSNSGPEYQWEAAGEGRSVDVKLYVDGSFGDSYRFSSSFDEVVSKGFTETEEYVGGANERPAKVRKFEATVRECVFKKAVTREGQSQDPATSESRGSICLEMNSGKLETFSFKARKRKFDVGNETKKASEKEAIKEGKSINIVPSFETVKQGVFKNPDYIPDPTSECTVHLFFRELFWMQSRRLLDRAGNLWTPASKPIRDFIDLMNLNARYSSLGANKPWSFDSSIFVNMYSIIEALLCLTSENQRSPTSRSQD